MSLTYKYCDSLITKQELKSDCFKIKQKDTCPVFKVQIIDPKTQQAFSLLNLEVKTFMYFESRLGSDIDSSMDPVAEFTLLGNKYLCQVKVGDIILIEDCNQSLTEYMEVTSIDSSTGIITANRGDLEGYTSIQFDHFKKDLIRFYRIFEKNGYVDSIYEDSPDTEEDEADHSLLVYQWDSSDTTHRGDYYLEFKITDGDISRTFPLNNVGYCIQII